MIANQFLNGTALSAPKFTATDQNLKSQQNLANRAIRILVPTTTSWPRISKKVTEILRDLDRLEEGGYSEGENCT